MQHKALEVQQRVREEQAAQKESQAQRVAYKASLGTTIKKFTVLTIRVADELKLKIKREDEKYYREVDVYVSLLAIFILMALTFPSPLLQLFLPKSADFSSMLDAIAAKLKASLREINEVLKSNGDEVTVIGDDADVARLEPDSHLVITMKA